MLKEQEEQELKQLIAKLGIKIDLDQINLFNRYKEILLKWQKSINLIGESSIENIWHRHILDSLQLAYYINSFNKNIYDFGSGAGLPGIVLAINNKDNIYHLVESDSKKATFLNYVRRELNLTNVVIHNVRIESLILNNTKADVIVSRALASLDVLLDMAKPLLNTDGFCLFLKGKNYENEITTAKVNHPNIICEIFESLNSQGKVLKIKNI